MPVYVFECSECGSRFDVLRRMSAADDPATCPQGHMTTSRVLITRYSTTGPAGNTPDRPLAPKARSRWGNAP